MSDNFDFDDSYMDDPSWTSLFDMAENYEGQEDSPLYENVSFYESSTLKDERYHTPEEALKVLFGYDTFRSGQKLVIDSILSGRDAFAVMPTGAGKSICYQIPAMILPGITLVISPLISLMQDQVKALNEAGVSAAFINSSLSENAFYETVRKVNKDYTKLYMWHQNDLLLMDSLILREMFRSPWLQLMRHIVYLSRDRIFALVI